MTSSLIADDFARAVVITTEYPLSNETELHKDGGGGGGGGGKPFLPDQNHFVVPIYGYISPILILITVVTNCLVCAVLLRRNMRSPTNALLVAIAAADLLTGVLPAPCFAYFYTAKRYRDWIPCTWSFLHYCLSDFLPTMFHTASIWLTVALAVQRYIYVCHAYRARELCTVANAVRVIICVYTAAMLSQVSRFTEHSYTPVYLPSRLYPVVSVNHTLGSNESLIPYSFPQHPSESTNVTVNLIPLVEACIVRLTPFIDRHAQAYFNVYYWSRVTFIHLVPCTALVVLNVILVDAMHRAQVRREQLLKQNRRSESRRLAESNCTTLMLVAVVGLFLLVEFPLAILLIFLIIQNSFDFAIFEEDSSNVAAMFVNFFILLSYPLNFFIYCGMSRQFRQTFKSMFCCCRGEKEGGGLTETGERTQYESLAPCTGVNGTPAKVTNETAL